MRVPKLRHTGFAIAIPILLGFCSYFFVFRTVAARHIVRADPTSNFVPFVLQQQIYLYSMNPAGELHDTLTVARRSDGTTVSIRSFGPLARGHMAERFFTQMEAALTW